MPRLFNFKMHSLGVAGCWVTVGFPCPMYRELANIFRIWLTCSSESPCSRCSCSSKLSFCCSSDWDRAKSALKPSSPKRINSPKDNIPIALISCPLLPIASHHIEEVPVIGVAEKARNFSPGIHFVHLAHARKQVIHEQLRPCPAIEREISVLERIHIQMHGVAAPVGLKHSSHR